jgi:hypothetical protein
VRSGENRARTYGGLGTSLHEFQYDSPLQGHRNAATVSLVEYPSHDFFKFWTYSISGANEETIHRSTVRPHGLPRPGLRPGVQHPDLVRNASKRLARHQ